MATEWRLDDRDQQQYGGPEWVSLDVDAILDMRTSELVKLEGTVAPLGLGDIIACRGVNGLRAHIWLARKQAGIVEELATFDPHVLRAERRGPDPESATAGGGDSEVPPDGSPSEPAPS